MTSVLKLPLTAVRVGGKVVRKLAWPAFAVTLIHKAIKRPASSPQERVTPDPGPVATKAKPARKSAATSAPEPVADHEPAPVVDPVPLAEPAVDLDVEVTLASDLPIRSYDALAAADAEQAIRDLTDPDEVRTVLRFEEENAKRDEVLNAAREQLAALEPTARR